MALELDGETNAKQCEESRKKDFPVPISADQDEEQDDQVRLQKKDKTNETAVELVNGQANGVLMKSTDREVKGNVNESTCPESQRIGWHGKLRDVLELCVKALG